MPNTQGAKRADRVQKRKRTQNLRVVRAYKTAIKDFFETPSEEKLNEVFSKVDTAAKKNIIHENKASRIKAKLSLHLENSN